MASMLLQLLPALISGGAALFGNRGNSNQGGQFQMQGRSGTPKGYDQFSTMNPQQSELLQQLLGSISGQQGNINQNPLYQSGQNYLQNLLQGGDQAFANFEAPFKRQFHEQTIPGLAERFAGMGAGAQSSSAFQNALGQAGAGLSENLASLRSQLQMQALPQALQYANQPFSNIQKLLGLQTQGYQKQDMPWWQSLLGSLAGGAGQGLGAAGAAYGMNKLGLR